MSIKDYRAKLEARVAAARQANDGRTMGVVAVAPAGPPSEDTMLQTLADHAAPATERLAALAGLKVLSFASPRARQLRPRFIECLRSAADDPGVRLAALGALTEMGDVSTRENLIAGLRDPATALVTKPEALELLANDQHADAIDVARKTVDDGDDHASVTAALPLLARDPESVGRLHRIISDTGAPDEHRRRAVESLFALDKSELDAAKVSDDPDLRSFVVGLLEPRPRPVSPAPSTRELPVAKKKTRTSAKKKPGRGRGTTTSGKARAKPKRAKPGKTTRAKGSTTGRKR